MRLAPKSQDSIDQQVYIPYHEVIRESSTTTRLRVVFNASSVTSNGTSLNDHLLLGLKLQTEITSVILCWRQCKYVYAADIAKMYRQIRLDPRDIDYQRILWKPPTLDHITEYQLLTVTYGMACVPFLALRVSKQLSNDEGHRFPLAVPILRDNIYVDDVLFGADDPITLKQTRDQLISLLKCSGFELRKWASNSSALLTDLDVTDAGIAYNKPLAQDEQLRILGIDWNPINDIFEFRISFADRIPNNKRTILSSIAKFYDPLGWVTPATVTIKLIMQDLWRSKLNWDENLPETLFVRWQRVYSRLSILSQLQIPRWNSLGPEIHHAEIHGFANASTAAYAAAVYLRTVSSSGHVMIRLLAGKSKVTPLKPLSIPRLELSAALLLARLTVFVRESIYRTNISCYCWSDSTIVLTWVTQHPSRWKTFVANRVTEIQSLLPNVEWHHVPIDDNPADCALRGVFSDDLINHDLWWHGPPWLRFPTNKWPSHNNATLPKGICLEEKVLALQCSKPNSEWDLSSRYSSWPKLIRVTAYIFKFTRLCRRNRSGQNSCPADTIHSSAPKSVALFASDCNASKFF